ncbi:MAG: helix-turn-helix domain-containing protein [Caulobacterales bacterium]|uniref:helix-turn-helix domain-containing protein n=1 Tax=Glycocaulis sp. TaxID=1969725 RepID=UPI003FA0F9E9
MALIETSHFNTRGISPLGRFSAWRENIGVVFDVSPYDEKTEERFFAKVDSFLLDGILINHCKLGAQQFSRTPGRIARDGIDHYQFHVFLKGSVDMVCGQRQKSARPGDFVVLDHGDTFSSQTTDYEILNVFIPRRRLAPLLNRLDSAHGHVFDSASSVGLLLRDYVVSLCKASGGLSLADAPGAARPLLDLAALALNGARTNPDDPPALVDHALLLKAQVFIKENLGLPALGPDLVAQASGVSRARLYRLFEPCGGIAAYIREMRLRRAFTDLASPSNLHRQVAEIAFQYGFSDAAHFSRSFRARFGIAPSDIRADRPVNEPGPVRVSEEFGDTKYAFWIASIA